MSIDTWKKKFYPTPPTKDMSLLECVNLGIKKFRGATPENLEKHGLFLSDGRLFENKYFDLDENHFTFGWEECGFCLKFINNDCAGCPIVQEFGYTCSDACSGFDSFLRSGNPRAILDELIQIKTNIKNGKDYESNL